MAVSPTVTNFTKAANGTNLRAQSCGDETELSQPIAGGTYLDTTTASAPAGVYGYDALDRQRYHDTTSTTTTSATVSNTTIANPLGGTLPIGFTAPSPVTTLATTTAPGMCG